MFSEVCFSWDIFFSDQENTCNEVVVDIADFTEDDPFIKTIPVDTIAFHNYEKVSSCLISNGYL